MGYGAGRTMGRRVWAIVRALSVRGRKASPFSLSLSLFISPCVSLSASNRPRALPLFYYFQTRHFFSELLFLSLSFALVGRGGATLEKTCWKSHNRNVRPLLDIINVDRWTSLPWRRVKCDGAGDR